MANVAVGGRRVVLDVRTHSIGCHDAFEQVTKDGNDLVDALNKRNDYRPVVASYY